MRKHSLFFLSLLVPAFLGLGGYAVVQGQQKGSPAAGAKRWSDAATWPDKKVPAKDALVTITKDMNVVMDVSPMPLHGLTIEGKLSFADDKDLELTTEWIMVHGELEIGTEAKPHTRKANATSYFRGGDALWVKLVVTKPPLPIVRPTDLQASIAVSR